MWQRSLVFIKPDGVKRKLVGNIISIYEKKNISITNIKMENADRSKLEKHYEEHKGKVFYEDLIAYIQEGPILLMILEGEDVIDIIRKINGDKNFRVAELGSIRGQYSLDDTYNLVHASDSMESAEREIKIWF